MITAVFIAVAVAYVATGIVVARCIVRPWVEETWPLSWADGKCRSVVAWGLLFWPVVLVGRGFTLLGRLVSGD